MIVPNHPMPTMPTTPTSYSYTCMSRSGSPKRNYKKENKRREAKELIVQKGEPIDSTSGVNDLFTAYASLTVRAKDRHFCKSRQCFLQQNER